MGFVDAIRAGFSNYVNFSGRAVRSEYWYWLLFTMLAELVAAILDTAFFGQVYVGHLYVYGAAAVSPLSTIVYFGTLLPSLSVSIRRLHDIDRTGWWILIGFTGIGIILLLVWACLKGTPGYNRFGPDPFGSGGHIPRPATPADRVREEEWRRRGQH